MSAKSALGILILATSASAAMPGPKPIATPVVRQVAYVVEHERDGKKYPNPLRESYRLGRDGVLEYRANFGGMPIEMNHGDSRTWNAGASGRRVLDLALALADELIELSDDRPAPGGGVGVYLVGLSIGDGDRTRYVNDPKAKAWSALAPAFQAMIAAFEEATGRPLKPGQLPQLPER